MRASGCRSCELAPCRSLPGDDVAPAPGAGRDARSRSTRPEQVGAGAGRQTDLARSGPVRQHFWREEALNMAKKRGRGVASVNYPTGMNLGGDPSQALVHATPGGKFMVALSSIDLGQGMKSV